MADTYGFVVAYAIGYTVTVLFLCKSRPTEVQPTNVVKISIEISPLSNLFLDNCMNKHFS